AEGFTVQGDREAVALLDQSEELALQPTQRARRVVRTSVESNKYGIAVIQPFARNMSGERAWTIGPTSDENGFRETGADHNRDYCFACCHPNRTAWAHPALRGPARRIESRSSDITNCGRAVGNFREGPQRGVAAGSPNELEQVQPFASVRFR